MGSWITLERPGYLGSKRDQKIADWNERYDTWRLVWKFGKIYVTFPEVCSIYEDAYFDFLNTNPSILEQLVSEAYNVYDDQPTNVDSKFDYNCQETNRTHIQDITIRRCLLRKGIWFQGDKLIQIRDSVGDHPLSMFLSPGKVSFHRKDLISKPEIDPVWWDVGSVESFYQSNKYLQINE